MPKPRPNRLDDWEVAIIKAMLADGRYVIQDIQAYFSRPTRTLNHARIIEIKGGGKRAGVTAASREELEAFLREWPRIDWRTGLDLHGDELLVKAREAMLHAVQSYNDPQTVFKAEMFIVAGVIAWTYLLHAHFKAKRVDYRHKKRGEVQKTKHGADKYWELEECLNAPACPLDEPTKSNLLFLIELRHEIEHRMTRRIDDTISAKLQACCLNFNLALKTLFGERYGLDGQLSFALQFAAISREQGSVMLKDAGLPQNVLAMQLAFEEGLSEEIAKDSRFAYRVAFVEKAVNRKGQADQVIEFIKSDSAAGQDITRVLLKDVEKPKYRAGKIVAMMKAEGFPRFTVHEHAQFWKSKQARGNSTYGVFLNETEWWWYDTWVAEVRSYCVANAQRFGPPEGTPDQTAR